MPYFGTLSVNRYKIHGTTRTRPEVLEWMDILATKVRRRRANLTPPIIVKVSGRFADERSAPDLDNLAKVTQDAIKVGLGIDDKYFRYVAEGYTVGYNEPCLVITIEGS